MTPRLWIVLPAAGSGDRFQQQLGGDDLDPSLPKQYQRLIDASVMATTIAKMADLKPHAVLIAVASGDDRWRAEIQTSVNLRTVEGGASRRESVGRCLAAIEREARGDDWVLTHDVVRPCVRVADIQRLLREIAGDECGGLLALPVSDTVKRVTFERGAGSGRVEQTIPREQLMLAQTPQVFRFGVLMRALRQGGTFTDECSAVEALGLRPRWVLGHRDNLKITWPEDLFAARDILRRQRADTA